jgi:NAD(P)-dependent dehydrogenase (short-subunit alcohol dehydrogenase family)
MTIVSDLAPASRGTPLLNLPRRASTDPVLARRPSSERQSVPDDGSSGDDTMSSSDGYFVTGGTGFLGRHLVDRLLRRPGAEVFVLVREQSLGRFRERAATWNAGDRVVPVVGDVGVPDLGLRSRQVADLRGRVGHFFHVAGLYDMAASSEALWRTNVVGTHHAVVTAARMAARTFHHVSSIAVAGRYPGTFCENMFDEATGLDDPYFRTKHDAERIVRSDCTLPWRIYRPSLIVGRSDSGEMDKVDGPYYLFPLLERLGALLPSALPLPGLEGGFLNLVPVDYVAGAIDHIAHQEGRDGGTFHLVDPVTRTFGATLDVFADAAGAPRLSLRLPLEGPVAVLGHVFARDADGIAGRVAERLTGIPPRVLDYACNPTTFDSSETSAALADSGIAVPPLEAYARALWLYWERNLWADTSHRRSLERAVRGKVALVTGASSGIGRATALKLGAAGARVVLVARSADRLEEVRRHVEHAGGTATAIPTDLTDAESVARLCRTVAQELGAVDVLVNNAGRSIRRSLSISHDRFHDFERTMQVNYFGAVRLILGLLPAMRARGQGHIVNVSSIGVQVGPPRFAAYVASKAALDGFSRCAAPELMGDGIDLTTVYMPLVKTDMSAPTRLYDSFSAITAAQAADMICDAIVRRPRQVSTLTGVMGQLTAGIAPRLYDFGMYIAYRLFPDSAAARGQPASPAAEQPSSLGRAFARLLPGVHW